MMVHMPDIELAKACRLVREGQGMLVSEACSCGRHRVLKFYACVEASA